MLRSLGNPAQMAPREKRPKVWLEDVESQPSNDVIVRKPSQESGLALIECRTWSKALAQAHDPEHLRDLPARILRGNNLITRMAYTGTLAPPKWKWCLNVLTALAHGGVGVAFAVKCDLSPPVLLAELLMGANYLTKVLTHPCGDREDWPVYTLMRAWEDQERQEFWKDIDLRPLLFGYPLPNHITMKLLAFTFTTHVVCLVVLGVHHSQDMATIALLIGKFVIQVALLLEGVAAGVIYFWAICRGLSRMINSHELWDIDGKGQIDMASAYKGFHGMLEQTKAVSTAYQGFFFVAEFVLVIAVIVWGFATWSEARSDSDAKALRMAYVASEFALVFTVVTILLITVANVTGAVHSLPERVHKFCAQVAVMDKAQLADAQAFYLHAEKSIPRSGFQSMGLVVSPGIIAKVAYTGILATFSVISFALTVKDKVNQFGL